MDSSKPKIDVYEIVTNRIIQLLEQGTVPWQQPWTEAGIPANLLSKRPYRGINLWLLLSLNYERNLFLTWDQLKKLGGSVNRGEHGHVVVFWKTVSKNSEAESENKKNVPLLRYYKVFNIAQCRDLPENLIEPLLWKEHDPILECEAIINGMPGSPVIKHKGQKAFYDIPGDYITMPVKKCFKSKEGYYKTLFHEFVHWTGSEKRLNRKSITEMAEFGSELYSIEELIAELGAAFLCSSAGILSPVIGDAAAYINGWLEKLRGDKKFIVHASGFAQKAVDFILNQHLSSTDSKEEVEQSGLLTED